MTIALVKPLPPYLLKYRASPPLNGQREITQTASAKADF
jgi:hypothetical protein